ncbi:GNAT family N-acetyltransferase [Pusillimonas minor]|uniref:N-acetyltransferase n=1 Tax=Pusillimonas minor TaxID=2697024 RepID=A0A842HNL8_9BURK|nr:GNAT family N-acetyltransferase [Pusillimonas minor]MBC2770489.1 N-acetyltransferase [Pusillimonas minor]
MTEELSLARTLDDIAPEEWNALAKGHPLASHAFLHALEASGCASLETGWDPHYLLLKRNGQLAGAMPLFVKYHSRGEYVFDHAWARAFMQHNLPYYPKLLSAIPFSPVPGPRLLARSPADRTMLAQAAVSLAQQNALSSLHILFPDDADQAALREAGFMFRETVQFHWHNNNYGTIDDFLAGMTQQKRKKLKQDRKKVAAAGITFKWLRGNEITADDLAFFYRCYERTYHEHGNAPYLNADFFERIWRTMGDQLLLVLAHRDETPVACAFNIIGEERLYGRYWGTTEFVSGLHFETCYLQAIEYCIAHQIKVFEGGAQGEHKLSRGMLPVKTWSAHWVRDARFAQAIANFLDEETRAVDHYAEALVEHSPFR